MRQFCDSGERWRHSDSAADAQVHFTMHSAFKSRTLGTMNSKVDDDDVEVLIASILDAFWLTTLHPLERRLFVAKLRGKFLPCCAQPKAVRALLCLGTLQ